MATQEAGGWIPGSVVFAGVMMMIGALTAYSPRSSGMGA
jgi:hypothetical protein